MILISSIRPFASDPDGTYQRNQLAAKASWDRVASRIIYFNVKEPALDSAKTVWIPSEDYPTILSLVELAAQQTEWTALINADIVLGANLPLVEAKLKARKAKCASSWRWNFDPAIGIQSGVHNDWGGDFFAAVPAVWQKAYEMIDDRLTIASGGWDQWTLSFFCTFYPADFWNLTNSRVIFHPIHHGRVHGPRVELDLVQTYQWPQMSENHI